MLFVPWVTEVVLTGNSSICAGSTGMVQVAPIPGASFAWDNGSTGTLRPITGPGWYTVQATGLCIHASDSILVAAEDCNSYIHVPNAFTPNEDGDNDVFLPILAGPVDAYQLDIFDRWGERIHTTTDPGAGWDGSSQGTPAQDGVYVWKLRHRVLGPEGVNSQELLGHVTLLR